MIPLRRRRWNCFPLVTTISIAWRAARPTHRISTAFSGGTDVPAARCGRPSTHGTDRGGQASVRSGPTAGPGGGRGRTDPGDRHRPADAGRSGLAHLRRGLRGHGPSFLRAGWPVGAQPAPTPYRRRPHVRVGPVAGPRGGGGGSTGNPDRKSVVEGNEVEDG